MIAIQTGRMGEGGGTGVMSWLSQYCFSKSCVVAIKLREGLCNVQYSNRGIKLAVASLQRNMVAVMVGRGMHKKGYHVGRNLPQRNMVAKTRGGGGGGVPEPGIFFGCEFIHVSFLLNR